MLDRRAQEPLVSVVIPVFEPGPAIEPCIESLIAQTLRPESLEIIFVDDGSRDETPARLDRLAAEHAHVRVIHEPNSGWAGRPRNVGIGAARGRYIQFVDQDDRLAPEALERCAAMAEANGTDIVLGKVTSDFRGVPHGVFHHDRHRCTVFDGPLIDSLTPHKLFRASFLREHEIRFPEGRRRLEDQVFMVRAYFAGASASILASYPCYFYLRRRDGANAGSEEIDPAGYYDNLREVLDIVVAGTEAGPDRDRFLARFLRVEMLRRVERDLLGRDPQDRDALVSEVAAVMASYVTPGALTLLSPLAATRARLVKERATDRLVTLAERLAPLRATARITSATWTRGQADCRAEAAIVTADGKPVHLAHMDGRWSLDPSLTHDVVPEPVDVTNVIEQPKLQAFAASRDGTLWRLREREVTIERDAAGASVTVRARLMIDPTTAAAGGPLAPGAWRLRVRVVAAGLDRWTDVGESAPLDRPGAVGRPPIVAELRTRDGKTNLELGQRSWTDAVAGRPVLRQRSGGRRLVAGLAIAGPPGATVDGVIVRRVLAGRTTHHRGGLVSRRSTWWVTVRLGPVWRRVGGRQGRVEVALDGREAGWTYLGEFDVDRFGRVRWTGTEQVGLAASARRLVGRLARAHLRRVLGVAKSARRAVRR